MFPFKSCFLFRNVQNSISVKVFSSYLLKMRLSWTATHISADYVKQVHYLTASRYKTQLKAPHVERPEIKCERKGNIWKDDKKYLLFLLTPSPLEEWFQVSLSDPPGDPLAPLTAPQPSSIGPAETDSAPPLTLPPPPSPSSHRARVLLNYEAHAKRRLSAQGRGDSRLSRTSAAPCVVPRAVPLTVILKM